MRQYWKITFDLFCRITACCFFFSSLYILFFEGRDVQVGLDYVWGILILAALTALITRILPAFSERKLTRGGIFLRFLLHFLGTNAIVMATGYRLRWYEPGDIAAIGAMLLIIWLIYGIVAAFTRYLGNDMADKLNKKLRERKK